jgi:sugar phosphate isomerase/epimerase
MTHVARLTMSSLSRRAFLQAAAGATAAVAASHSAGAQSAPVWPIGGFTKELQDLSFAETARVAEEIGWDGIELALRAGGHVLPERADEDLPRMVEALRARRRDVLVLATDIVRPDPLAEKVLRAAVRSGIRLYRMGYYRYRDGTPIAQQLEAIRPQLKALAALNRDLGVQGLLQNHSGNGYVGAAIWDLHALIDDVDPAAIGVHFDIGHATVEGGLSWPTNFALVKDRIGAVIVKDFSWKLAEGRGGTPEWCPLGRGMVQPRFFGMLRASGFRGPLTMQFEYPFGDGSLEARVRAFKADNAQLRAWVGAA